MKKFDLNFVKNSFKKEGYTLLSNFYLNSNKQKLKYLCPNGHKHSIIFSNWLRGIRCPYCAGQGKPSIAFVKKEFNRAGYNLLSDVYKNCYTKLNYVCDKGHHNSIRWSDWYNHGQRCPDCANIACSIRISGINHPQWKGGVSCDPYCDAWADKEYKESIKERDGYKCLNPACNNKSNMLSIHHIDYDKKNCRPDNLITLCVSCNTKANYDRNWHKAWYQAILNKRTEIRRN